MMKIWSILLILITSFSLQAQDSLKLNSVYIEAGGIGAYGSIGYERIIPMSTNWNFGARAAVSTLKLNDFNGNFNPDIILPLSFSFMYGKTHMAELGFANTITGINEADGSSTVRYWSSNSALTVGYRFNAEKSPFYFKCYYSPMMIRYERLIHWGGIGFGYKF